MTQQKRKRVPLGEHGLRRLQEPSGLDHDKYRYRWINDSPGRIEAATAGGYTPVTAKEKIQGGDVNSSHSIVNNRATGQRSVLMKIPRELYEEDQKAKEQRTDAVDQAIMRQEFEGRSIENVYTPEGGGIKSEIKHTE